MTSDELVKDYAKLIYKIASKFYGVEKEDLYQAGMMGLFDAYKHYDPLSNAKFSTFAYKYIFGEMYALANKKMLKVNRDTLNMYKLIEKTRNMYTQEYGHVLTNLEVANILNVDINTIDYVCSSMCELVSMDNDADNNRSMYEAYASEVGISDDDRILMYQSLELLPKEEKEVIIKRYFKDETQADIAKKLSTSQVKVSRLEKKGLSRMRKLMQTH